MLRTSTTLAFVSALLVGCLAPVGQEGIATRSLQVRSSPAVEKEEVAAVGTHDLFLYMRSKFCAPFAQSTGAVPRGHGRIDINDSYEELITALMCHRSYSSYGGPTSASFVKIHLRMDDRRLNHLEGAIALVLCTGEKWCNGPIATGTMAWYARNIDRAAVRAAVENVNIPIPMQQAFLRRADAASKLILYRASKLDPRRKALYLDLVTQIRADRARHWQEHAGLWKRYSELRARARDAVSAGTTDRALIAKISGLRDEYFRACVKGGRMRDECLHGQLARPLTEELVRLAIAARDPVLATTENAVLLSGKDRSTLGEAVYVAQYEAMLKERKRYDQFARARREGADEATIRNTYGDPPPIKIDAASAWRPPRARGDKYRSLIAALGRTERVRGIVKRVRVRGERATLMFDREMLKPVTVPAVDARGIVKGNEVVAIIDSSEARKGYVVLVKQGRMLVGVRMFR